MSNQRKKMETEKEREKEKEKEEEDESMEGEEEKKKKRRSSFFSKEESVGIRQFVNPHILGFRGFLKERYTDFIVHEISLDGSIVTLSDIKNFSQNGESEKKKEEEKEEKGEEEESGKEKEEREEKEEKEMFEMFDLPEVQQKFDDIIGKEEREKLFSFLRETPKKERETAVLYLKPLEDKSKRGQIHKEIRSLASLSSLSSSLPSLPSLSFQSKTVCDEKHHTRKEEGEGGKRGRGRDRGRKKGRREREREDRRREREEREKGEKKREREEREGGEGSPLRKRAKMSENERDGDEEMESSSSSSSLSPPKPEAGSICVSFWTPFKKERERKKGKETEKRAKYTEFVLYKENKDTTDVINVLSRFLGRQSRDFSFAGTKDKRGVTTQLMRVANIQPKMVIQLNSKLFGIRIGHPFPKEKPLSLGRLRGNHFTLAIRRVEGKEEDINRALEYAKENGFINYFGMQRFGNTSISTHTIGRAILRGDWEEAVNLILKPRDGELSEEAIAARQYWVQTGDVVGSIDKFPKQLYIEKQVLRGLLGKERANYYGALGRLDRTLRMMYVHSYQSFLFNSMASLRIERGGKRVLEGDLVFVREEERKGEEGEEKGEGEDGEVKKEKIEEEGEKKKREREVHIVTKEEAEREEYSLSEVVLPLPGEESIYPSNFLKEEYKSLIERDNLSLENCFSLKQREYCLKGEYRNLVAKGDNVSWKIVSYLKDEDQLCQTDLDMIEKRERGEGNEVGEHEGEGNKKAVIVSFSLPSSSYATMFLREIMKESSQAMMGRV